MANETTKIDPAALGHAEDRATVGAAEPAPADAPAGEPHPGGDGDDTEHSNNSPQA